MATEPQSRRKPAITLTRTDHDRLSRLAESAPARDAAIAEQLLQELDRARVVADDRIAASVVRMGSRLRFSSDNGADRIVTVVFPGEADIATGKISILTPIGAALIGLSLGQSIKWTARDGRTHRLRVECVDGTAMRTEARDAAQAPS